MICTMSVSEIGPIERMSMFTRTVVSSPEKNGVSASGDVGLLRHVCHGHKRLHIFAKGFAVVAS